MLKLGVDIIKIDKMFVDAIGTDRNSTTIVETLVDLARNMRMDVVAEGVENFEQVMHLRTLGVRLAQVTFSPRRCREVRFCGSSKPSIPCSRPLRTRQSV
jgi:sensor c-di-GMP phosphodiesterase-like protein